MLVILLILVSLMLSGCASTAEYCKTGATNADFQRDRQDCRSKTREMSGTLSMTESDYYDYCMTEGKGWKKCAE